MVLITTVENVQFWMYKIKVCVFKQVFHWLTNEKPRPKLTPLVEMMLLCQAGQEAKKIQICLIAIFLSLNFLAIWNNILQLDFLRKCEHFQLQLDM